MAALGMVSTMAKWIRDEVKPVLEKWERIICFDCGKDVSKSAAKQNHRGHDVGYANKAGVRSE